MHFSLEFYIFILLTYDSSWQELVARSEGSKLDIVCYLAFSHNINLLRWMQQPVHLLTFLDPLHQKPQIQSDKTHQRFDLMWTFSNLFVIYYSFFFCKTGLSTITFTVQSPIWHCAYTENIRHNGFFFVSSQKSLLAYTPFHIILTSCIYECNFSLVFDSSIIV